MRPGRLFILLTSVAAAGAALVRPVDIWPVAARYIEPLFAQSANSSGDRPAEPALPDYIPGDHQLTFAPQPDPVAVGAAAPAAAIGGVTVGGLAAQPQKSETLASVPPAQMLTTAIQTTAIRTGDGATALPPAGEIAAPALPITATATEASATAAEPDGAPAQASVVTEIEPIVPGGGAPPVGEPQARLQPSIAAKTLFGSAKVAAPMAARSIGSYARGCLAGAVALPVDGPAWQAMRLSRNRNWGHPKLISLVERLATDAKKLDGWPGLLVGDISQPRGGPMLTGHASHQVGLDADVWLTPMPDHRLSNKEREDIAATSMLDSTDLAVDPKIFTADHVKLIKRAASYPEVERVLVHPAIKKALCAAAGTDRKWLGKVRPIGGHYYHFHIRMACPPGSMLCKPQKPPTGEDGCTKEVDEWLARLAPPKTPPPPPPPGYKPPPPKPSITMAQLPTECTAVLESGPDGVVVPAAAKAELKYIARAPASLRPHMRKIRSAAAKR